MKFICDLIIIFLLILQMSLKQALLKNKKTKHWQINILLTRKCTQVCTMVGVERRVSCQVGWDSSQEIRLAWDFNPRKDSKTERTGVTQLPAVPMGRIQYMATIIFLPALEEFLKRIEADKSIYLAWSNRFLRDYAFLSRRTLNANKIKLPVKLLLEWFRFF